MFGATTAFLAVTLFVKFAELLLTQEHRLYIPASGFVVRHLAQVWLSLRFSWQDFAVAGALFAALAAVAGAAHRPIVRRTLTAMRWILGALTLLTALGIAYYAVYQAHITTTDFGYIRFAPQILATASLFRFWSVRIAAVVFLILFPGLPWLCRRLNIDGRRASVAATVFSLVASAGLYAAGRPNLAEASLEANPALWLVAGKRTGYLDLPPTEVLAPIGPRTRRYQPNGAPKNLIIVVLESTPARALFQYDPASNAGRRLAEQHGGDVTVFENVYTEVPNSGSAFFGAMMGHSALPSLDAALTRHKNVPAMSQLLNERGYRAEMHLNGYSDVSMTVLRHTFDRLLDAKENWPGLDRYAKLLWGYDERLLFDEARAYLQERSKDSTPFFLVLYTSAPHAPYSSGLIPGLRDDPDPKVRHRLMVQYDMDLLTDLYAGMKQNGLAESTAILAYGDHGEAFNEHQNNIIHSKAVFDENVHVPLLLIHPGRFGLPARIGQLGSLLDILPTSFDLMGLPLEPRAGMSLFFDAPERLVFSLTDYGPGQIGLRDKRFTYILFRNGKELFFDRESDPAELTNVLDRFPDDVARFRARLRQAQ